MLLHGRGADEHDLFPLLDALDPERRLLGITPRGPLALPPGGAHWYRLGGIPTPDPATFFPTFEAAAAFLDALPVPMERVVLGGFSQGAVMSWALGLGAGRPRPAAILAMSGFMPEVPGFELDLGGLEGYPVAVVHGSLDPVIPVEFGRAAAERVRARRSRPPLAGDARAAHDRPAGAARSCRRSSRPPCPWPNGTSVALGSATAGSGRRTCGGTRSRRRTSTGGTAWRQTALWKRTSREERREGGRSSGAVSISAWARSRRECRCPSRLPLRGLVAHPLCGHGGAGRDGTGVAREERGFCPHWVVPADRSRVCLPMEGALGHGDDRDRCAQAHPHGGDRRRCRAGSSRSVRPRSTKRRASAATRLGGQARQRAATGRSRTAVTCSRRHERDLLAAGERIVRVPPKLMADARRGGRTYGKSDPIDALAVARAALREPGLPDRSARRPRARPATTGRPSPKTSSLNTPG